MLGRLGLKVAFREVGQDTDCPAADLVRPGFRFHPNLRVAYGVQEVMASRGQAHEADAYERLRSRIVDEPSLLDLGKVVGNLVDVVPRAGESHLELAEGEGGLSGGR